MRLPTCARSLVFRLPSPSRRPPARRRPQAPSLSSLAQMKRLVTMAALTLVLLGCSSTAARLPVSAVNVQAREVPADLHDCARTYAKPPPPVVDESDREYANDAGGCGQGAPTSSTRWFGSFLLRYPDEKQAQAAYVKLPGVQGAGPLIPGRHTRFDSTAGASTGFGAKSVEEAWPPPATTYCLVWQRGPYVFQYSAIGLGVYDDRRLALSVYQRTPDK
jgi:hypothetical protein